MPDFECQIDTYVTVEFEVFCAKCGAGLCGNCTTGTSSRRGMPYVQVEPCEACLKESYENGVEESQGEI